MNIERLEKIKIVFSINDFSDIVECKVGNIIWSESVESNDLFDLKILRKIVAVVNKFEIATNVIDRGKCIALEKYSEKVEKEGKWLGKIEIGGFLLRFGKVTSMKQAFLIIEQTQKSISLKWDSWLTPFLCEENFVQAWVSDVEYDFWQNATDILEYELAGVNYKDLPIKSNGLPPPLEENEIDVSQNPGRWSFNKGFIEAIGSIMWLGPLFWNYVGDRREKLKSLKWLKVTDLSNDITYLQVPDVHFFDLSTKNIQDELRKNLYG